MTMVIYAILFWCSAVRLLRSRGLLQAAGFFSLVYVIAFSAECWAQEHGLFGVRYAFERSRWPGPAFGALPYFVPCLWFAMMVPTQDLAFALLRRAPLPTPWVRALATGFVGAALMTLWDLVLDPVSVGQGLWHYEGAPYPFFDVPIENVAAWLTGTLGTHLILYIVLPRPPAKLGVSPVIYGLAALGYLPFLPDARLGLVSVAMVAAALAAAGLAAEHAGRFPLLPLRPRHS